MDTGIRRHDGGALCRVDTCICRDSGSAFHFWITAFVVTAVVYVVLISACFDIAV